MTDLDRLDALAAAMDEQRLYAKYSGARTHGVHVNKDIDCAEYVVGQCFIDAAVRERDELRAALNLWAIPTLLVFAEDNAGAREAVRALREVAG